MGVTFVTRARPAPHFGVRSAPDDEARPASRSEGLAVLTVLAVIVGLVIWGSIGTDAPPARTVHVVGGSAVLSADSPYAPVVLDLATGLPTLQLSNAPSAVRANSVGNLGVFGLDGATLLLNTASGAVNYLDPDNLLVNRTGGVALYQSAQSNRAWAVPVGGDAFVIKYGQSQTGVWLVSRRVVEAGIGGSGGRTGPGRHRAPQVVLNVPISANGKPEAVTAYGALWMITGGAGTNAPETLQEIVRAGPGGSSLQSVDRGSVPPGSVLTNGHTAGLHPRDLVALASGSNIRLFNADGSSSNVSVPGGVGPGTAVKPVDPCTGSAWFVYQDGPSSWRLVGTHPSQFGSAVTSVRLKGMDATSVMSPACDGRSIYAMAGEQSGSPRLVVIDPSTGMVRPVPGLANGSRYPVAANEGASYNDAQVMAFGPRVVFNNPSSLNAVTVFTDGSHPPVTFRKTQATSFDPAAPPGGGVARKGGHPSTNVHSSLSAAVPPAQTQADNKAACTQAGLTEKPRVPQIQSLSPGPHSVLVSWSYDLLTSQDCEPQTFEITVTPLNGASAPSTPQTVVNDVRQYTVTGLAPDSSYSFVVTAFIGQQSTASAAVTVTTSAAGPDAPTSVTTSADGTGWIVHWQPCTGSSCQNVVPVQSWIVTGSVCGPTLGHGVGYGATIDVGETNTTTTIPFGTNTPVGIFMSFTVQGVGLSDVYGDSTTDKSCTEGWAPPDPKLFTLDTTTVTPPGAPSASEQLQAVPQGVDAATAFGSNEPQWSFTVTGPGLTQPWQSGTVNTPSATVSGLSPNGHYVATVTVNPTGHPTATASVQTTFTPSSIPWPDGLVISGPSGTINQPDPNTATITATLQNAFADGPPDLGLVASVNVGCNNVEIPESNLAVTPNGQNGGITIANFDAVNYGGSCTIQLTALSETGTDVHGGPFISTNQPIVPFVLGSTSLPAISAANFASAWNPDPPQPGTGATPYAGSSAIATPGSGFPILPNAGTWTESFAGTLSGGSSCTSPTSGSLPPAPWSGGSLPAVDVSGCLQAAASSLNTDTGTYGGSVVVTYFYLGMSESTSVPLSVFTLQATSVPSITSMAPANPGGCTPSFCPTENVTVSGLHLVNVTQLTLTPAGGSATTLGVCPLDVGPTPTCFITARDSTGAPDIEFQVSADLGVDPTTVAAVVTNPYGLSSPWTFNYQPGVPSPSMSALATQPMPLVRWGRPPTA